MGGARPRADPTGAGGSAWPNQGGSAWPIWPGSACPISARGQPTQGVDPLGRTTGGSDTPSCNSLHQSRLRCTPITTGPGRVRLQVEVNAPGREGTQIGCAFLQETMIPIR